MLKPCKASSTWARIVPLLAVAAGLVLAVLGCGGDGTSSGGPEDADAAANEKVTLTVGLFGTFGYKEAGLYDEYMKLHPNVTIKETSIEFEQDYYQALQTHLAGGAGLSDVQGIEVARIAEVTQTQADKFVDLRDLGADDIKDTFFPWKWDAATSPDGAVVGLGTDTGPLAICYRTDLFKQAGLPTDRDELASMWQTWPDFIEVGKQYAANAPGDSAFMDSASGYYNAIIGQSETQYYDADGNPIYDTNPAVKEAWDLAVQAIQAGLSAKLKQFDQPWNQAFANGRFATIACPAWMIGYIKGQAGDSGAGKWDVAPIPGGGGNWGGSYLAIPAASEHKEQAYDLIEWLTAPEQQVKMWTQAQHFPSSSTAADDSAVAAATDEYFSNAPVGELFKESADNLTVATLGPKDGVVKDTISNGLLRIEQQGEDPDTAWQKTLDDIANAIG
ncbi:MAG TPA: extracellular solute-binding protein [Gaiellaceae bacterium]|nr:extracellular solute-binding protein [Gaiellaceae bacterium]